MSYLDKYRLDKSSKKYICPQCNKKTLVVYIDVEKNEPANEYAFGRCDKENSCGYHVKPSIEHHKKPDTKVSVVLHPPESILKKLTESESNLHKFLATKGIPANYLYDLGVVTDRELTAYIFRNVDGKLMNIKYFKYKQDGHRDKSHDSFSLKQPEQTNEYVEQKYAVSLFLEHLLDKEKKKIVCVVESEKTAAIARHFYPQFDWVACGSANGLSDGSNGTADKITCLKGRVVYWLCDADQASRGKMMIIDKSGKEDFVWCSSVRNMIKHIDDCHVVDLFPARDDGYDIGDAILDGQRPEIAPTWSKKIALDKRSLSYVPPNTLQMKREFENGKEVGEPAHIVEMQKIFSWKLGFINCFTGWPNDGKSTFFLFMALIKAYVDGWKACIWSPEMISSYRIEDNGKPKVLISANDIYDELVFMLTGRCPYKHYEKQYGIKQMTWDEYHEAMEWVKKHFFIMYPQNKKPADIIDHFKYYSEVHGCVNFAIDPFKNLELNEDGRTDYYLDRIFGGFKEFAIMYNAILNIIAHPKSQNEPKNKDGSYKVCNQNMLAGGASWNNNMDGIYSNYRPNRHTNPTDPMVWFFTLKQRKQQLVGRVGVCKDIIFDFLKNRYYFNGICPIDQSEIDPKQAAKPLDFRKKKGKDVQINFDDHLIQDWGKEPDNKIEDTDETPF